CNSAAATNRDGTYAICVPIADLRILAKRDAALCGGGSGGAVARGNAADAAGHRIRTDRNRFLSSRLRVGLSRIAVEISDAASAGLKEQVMDLSAGHDFGTGFADRAVGDIGDLVAAHVHGCASAYGHG